MTYFSRRTNAAEHGVLVAIATTRGSSPRGAGARMLVTEEAIRGTIGGGQLEYACANIARELLATSDAGHTEKREIVLGPELSQCCGGVVEVSFEVVAARHVDRPDHPDEGVARLPVFLFGAGHVGKALVNILGQCDCTVTWVDSRAHEFPETLPSNVSVEVVDENYERAMAVISAASDDGLFLVMTHSHPIDYRVCRAILGRAEFRYAGLIGSKTKRARFRSHLLKDGLTPEQVDRLVCPIGLPETGTKRPGEIAVAVVAQLLQLRTPGVGTTTRPEATTVPEATHG